MGPGRNPSPSARLWVVQIGVDRYARCADLAGAVNDVRALRAVFETRFAVPAERIHTLLDEEATRANILDALRALLDNPAIGRDDEIVVHFSGHGGRMRDPLDATPDGLIQAWVPHDHAPDGAYMLPDRTLGAVMRALAAERTDRITVIADCCHAGSGLRARDPAVRVIAADPRPLPADLDAEWHRRAPADDGPATWTLLAACRDDEPAIERSFDVGDRLHRQGVFTWHLVAALERLRAGTTYAMLHDTVAARVGALADQRPQCEGRRDRLVFGAAVQPSARWPRVVGQDPAGLELTAGLLHGITPGSRITIHAPPPAARSAPYATGRAERIEPTRCRVVLDAPTPRDLIGARAEVMRRAAGGDRMPVHVAGDAPQRAALEQALADSPWLVPTDDPARAVVEVALDGAGGVLRAVRVQPPRVVSGALTTADDVARWRLQIENVARFRRICSLDNTDPGSAIPGTLALTLRRFARDRHPRDMPRVEPDRYGAIELPFGAGHDPVYVVEVHNRGAVGVFPHVFICGPDYSVTLLYPLVSGHVRLPPRRSLFIGHGAPAELMEIYLPDDADSPFHRRSNVRLLAVATAAPTDLGSFEQGELHLPTRARDAVARMLEAAEADRSQTDDWGTATLAFRVRRRG